MLQALGSMYMAFGALLGGSQPSQTCNDCNSGRNKRDLEERVSNMERNSINFRPAQPTSGITIHNNNTNTLISH